MAGSSASSIVNPVPRMFLQTPSFFNSTRVGAKVFGITWAAKLLVLLPLPVVAATALAALPVPAFLAKGLLTPSFDRTFSL